jgi:hypothetical protein
MSKLDVERLAKALDAHMVKFTEQPESYDSSTTVSQSIADEYARLAESRPSDELAAAAEEYLVAVGAYLDPSNQFTDSRRHHVEVTEAALRAALAEADSTAPAEPVMSVAMSDDDEGRA